ncbi:MAG TPA: hypothetical protein VKZ68_02010 [Ohtaekwangia sp.]|nr:hypothetical protein [Ohtaekwangia sp.]
MNSKILIITTTALLMSFAATGQGLVGKLKQKAEKAAEKALEKKAEEKTGIKTDDGSESSGTSNSGNSSGRPTNKGGGGLVSTPPDVKQNLSDAESAFKSANYGEARYAVQQAMLGVELEIGNKVLASLPESVSGLPKLPEEDQVTSTGWGWAGLTIQRVYRKDDKELSATIANNSAWMSAVNMYLANTGYAQQTGGQQNWKQIKIKGHRAVIEYDESSGYKISVPLGQSSLIVFQGTNYASEQEITSAANSFDIDGIKNMLGEK